MWLSIWSRLSKCSAAAGGHCDAVQQVLVGFDTESCTEISFSCMRKEGFPLVEKLIDISSYPVAQVLDVLLQDKTTKRISYGRPTLMRSLVKNSRTRCSWMQTPFCAEPISSAPASRSHRRRRRSEQEKSRGVYARMALQSDEQSLR